MEYDLEMWEDLQYSPLRPSMQELFGDDSDQETSSALPTNVEDQQTAPIQEEVFINGARIRNLMSLRPSTTIAEMKMRIDNDVQKFITREGVDIFIPKKVLVRLDLDRLMQIKARKFKINLPDRFEVTLRVYSDGRVMMYNHRLRKMRSKTKKN